MMALVTDDHGERISRSVHSEELMMARCIIDLVSPDNPPEGAWY